MKRVQSIWVVGLSAFAVTATLLGGVQDVSAAYRRVHSSQCHFYNDDAGSDLYNGAWLSPSTTSRGIYCPAPSDSELSHASTTTLNVHGFEAAGASAYSYACVKYFNAAGTSCGASKSWSPLWGGVYGVSTSAWSANSAGMPYVYTWLPAGSQLAGFFMSN